MSEALSAALQTNPSNHSNDTTVVARIASMGFSGDEMIEGFRRQPNFQVRGYDLNFNEARWVFTPKTETHTPAHRRKTIIFGDAADADIWKLFFICQMVWKNNKTPTNIETVRSARNAFASCGGTDARQAILSLDGYQRFMESMSELSGSNRYTKTFALSSFLRFRSTFFRVPNDPDLMRALEHDIKASGRLMSGGGTPPIDDGYLEPLVETCRRSLTDENEKHLMRIVAAVLLIASQVGMRISEARTLDAGALEFMPMKGKPDMAYINFRTYKGAKGDDGFRPTSSILSKTAMEAYLWLEDNCAADRARLETQALIATRRQKAKYISMPPLQRDIKLYLLRHRDTIPCVNTQEVFPELKSSTVSAALRKTATSPKEIGLTGDEIFVYPRFHSFRATVATKLYEEGVDLRYISKHMGHIDENTTIGYIQRDREIEKENNSLVYHTVIEDGAEFIGVHGSEFQRKIEEFVAQLPAHVKGNLAEVVKATMRKYPLRRKVGGVCIRCGKMEKCPTESETDQIYCAFGVCPNQCVLYFFADQCLGTVRSHMELIPINLDRGHIKAARNELRKAQNVMRDALVPELDSLEKQIKAHGREHIIDQFPELEQLVDTLPEVRKEIAEWQAMSI